MSRKSASADPTFGYLACVEDPAHGFTGGYLIVSQTGRPLEFHCTAPVSASRAQEILFGPTLRPYLIGEQIGQALLRKAALDPSLLVINDLDAAPTVAGGRPASHKEPLPPEMVYLPSHEDDAPPPAANWRRLTPESSSLWTNAADPVAVAAWLDALSGTIDIAEPFERIEQAIREAQRLGQQHEEPGGAIDRDAA